METKICQSCGMPMSATEHFGTNADNSSNEEYCVYCFKEGHYTQGVTMDEMIRNCADLLDEFNEDSEKKFTREEAITEMKKSFPLLGRWKNN